MHPSMTQSARGSPGYYSVEYLRSSEQDKHNAHTQATEGLLPILPLFFFQTDNAQTQATNRAAPSTAQSLFFLPSNKQGSSSGAITVTLRSSACTSLPIPSNKQSPNPGPKKLFSVNRSASLSSADTQVIQHFRMFGEAHSRCISAEKIACLEQKLASMASSLDLSWRDPDHPCFSLISFNFIKIRSMSCSKCHKRGLRPLASHSCL